MQQAASGIRLLEHLRAGTAELHRALESTSCMARFGAQDFGASDLVRVVSVLERGFSRVEPALTEASALDWYRPQAPALRAELTHLARFGGANESAAPASTEPPAPALASDLERLGAAYVLVGSRMGVRSIAKKLAATFGDEYLRAAPYYGLEQPHLSAQWGALQARMRAVPDDVDLAPVVEAAKRVFHYLIALADAAKPAG